MNTGFQSEDLLSRLNKRPSLAGVHHLVVNVTDTSCASYFGGAKRPWKLVAPGPYVTLSDVLAPTDLPLQFTHHGTNNSDSRTDGAKMVDNHRALISLVSLMDSSVFPP